MLPRVARSSIALALARVVCVLAAVATAAAGQSIQVSINDRTVADLGIPDRDVQEPSLAVTRSHRVGAHQVYFGLDNVRYAHGTNQSASWNSGALTGFFAGDPTVAVAVSQAAPAPDQFAVFAMNYPSSGTIRYCVFTPDWSPPFGPWTIAYLPTTLGNDKPWVVRRTANDFYMFFFEGGPNGYRYLRTSNGTYWGNAEIPSSTLPSYKVSTSTGPVEGTFCCQPAVGPDGRIYLAYATGVYGPPQQGGDNGKIRILRSHDPAIETAELLFDTLLAGEDQPVEVSPNLTQSQALPINVPFGSVLSYTVPYLVCDPTSAGRLYVFFHDAAASGGSGANDVNVYCARFTLGGDGYWDADTAAVHDNPVGAEGEQTDQFCPVGAVDSQGRVYVAYYDNRLDASGGQCVLGTGDDFDIYLGISTNQGQSFTSHNLRTDCTASRPLNLGLRGSSIPGLYSPREYNGIGLYESGGMTRVWLTYSGAISDIPEDDPLHKSLIFGQQIVVQTIP